MTALSDLPADARLYLRPLWFADSPVGLDGMTARIGDGLIWFQAYEIVARTGGRRVLTQIVPVADFDAALTSLPAALRARAEALAAGIATKRPPLSLNGRTIRFDSPQVMGILNMTPDSFSDGGRHQGDAQIAADAGFAMTTDGVAIVDVGGESTRPGADPVWEGDEIARVVPVIEKLAAAGVPVSIDTRKAAVMEAALAAGAGIVNDVSALLHDDRSLDVVARAGCPVVLMHVPSTGENLHDGARYADAAFDVFDWLEARVHACLEAGIPRAKIIVDPGLGFGKSLQDNLSILNRVAMYQALGVPVLVGVSRKRMIGALSNEAPVDKRLGGSVALAMQAFGLGAQIVRVHDVAETVQAARVWRGLRDAALSDC